MAVCRYHSQSKTDSWNIDSHQTTANKQTKKPTKKNQSDGKEVIRKNQLRFITLPFDVLIKANPMPEQTNTSERMGVQIFNSIFMSK